MTVTAWLLVALTVFAASLVLLALVDEARPEELPRRPLPFPKHAQRKVAALPRRWTAPLSRPYVSSIHGRR